MTTLDFQQAFRPTGPVEGFADRVWRRDGVVLRQDHQERASRNGVDEAAGSMCKDRMKRSHGDLVAPGRRDRRLRPMREVIAVLICLQCKALARAPGAKDVFFSSLG